MSELKRLRAENKALREVLAKYVEEDDTFEGGPWEERNAPWLKIKRDAQALLETKPPQDVPENVTMFNTEMTFEDLVTVMEDLDWQPHTWEVWEADLSELSDLMYKLTRAFLQLRKLDAAVREEVKEIFAQNGFEKPHPTFVGRIHIAFDRGVSRVRND